MCYIKLQYGSVLLIVYYYYYTKESKKCVLGMNVK